MHIVKRDGSVVPFDKAKIYSAVSKCVNSPDVAAGRDSRQLVKYLSDDMAEGITDKVVRIVEQKFLLNAQTPTVEQIQDLVEQQLMAAEEYAAAKHYILYRKQREGQRDQFGLTPAEAAVVNSDKQYFPTELQAFQFKDKYARWNPDAMRRETWTETVNRAIDFFEDQLAKKAGSYTTVSDDTWVELRDAILNMEAMPSMRVLQMAGPALERCHVGVYNCAFTGIEKLDDFAEILYVLMQGTGCGYSVEIQYVENLPRIKRQKKSEPVANFIVPDSTVGWCDALKLGLHTWFEGKDITFDYSLIRPAGTPLMTKGGRASGPEPLRRLLAFTRDKVLSRQGAWLRPVDAHDIACMCGDIVQVGGVRRAAEISLSDLHDHDMRYAKSGNWWESANWRAMANNSAVYEEKPGAEQFIEEWLSMVKSRSGERGIFNRGDLGTQIPKRRKKKTFGCNPCFAAGTLIETSEGRKRIEDLTTESLVYTMEADGSLGVRRASASWLTRKQADTLAITVNGGELCVTPEHKVYVDGTGWVEAADLNVGDRVVYLCRTRRGACYSGIKLTSEDQYRMEHRFLFESVYGPVPDGWDIHHENDDTYDNRLSNLRPLPHAHHAYVTAHEQSNSHQVKGNDGRFASHASSRRGAKTIVPMPEELRSQLHQYATITSIKPGPVVDVYDLSVEGTHNVIANNIVAHNCGEIILRSKQFCNLSIAVAREHDTLDDLKRKVRLATIFGTIQSTLTDFQYISSDWKKNCEEERLLGVDIIGQFDCELLRYNRRIGERTKRAGILQQLRQVAIDTNKEWAEKLGIQQSTAVTCVKPGGNASVLLGTSPGMHPRMFKYFVRRVTVGATSPMAKVLKDSGVPYVARDEANLLFEFPERSPEGALTEADLSAIDQLENWLDWKNSFTEHNPSVTVKVAEDEWLSVAHWVYEHWESIGGLTFLQKTTEDTVYKGMLPYEAISKEEYERRVATMPSVDYAKLARYEREDMTTVAKEFACVSGVCAI